MIHDRHESGSRALDAAASTRYAPPTLSAVAVSEIDLATRVVAAVDALPLGRRALVRMYLTGYEQEDIAKLLGWTEARTRDQLRPALEELRTVVAGARGGGVT